MTVPPTIQLLPGFNPKRRLLYCYGIGDCLEPIFPNGSLSFFDEELPCRDGDWSLVRIIEDDGHEAHVVKRLRKIVRNSEEILALTAPNFPPLQFDPQICSIVGRLVAVAIIPGLNPDPEATRVHNIENEEVRRQYREQYGHLRANRCGLKRKQLCAIRELVVDPNNADAKARVVAINEQIVGLRTQLG